LWTSIRTFLVIPPQIDRSFLKCHKTIVVAIVI
jgi:hypothetical protein